jgi:hypothetical protein
MIPTTKEIISLTEEMSGMVKETPTMVMEMRLRLRSGASADRNRRAGIWP